MYSLEHFNNDFYVNDQFTIGSVSNNENNHILNEDKINFMLFYELFLFVTLCYFYYFHYFLLIFHYFFEVSIKKIIKKNGLFL